MINRSLTKFDKVEDRGIASDKEIAVLQETVKTLRKDLNNAHAKIRDIEK